MLKHLPISILFHTTLALIYLPVTIFSAAFSDFWTGYIALSALIGLGIIAAL